MVDAGERPPEPQFEGYLVVLRPEAHARWLEERAAQMPDPPAYRAWSADLRRDLGGLDVARYAGIARDPIDRWREPLTDEQIRSIVDMQAADPPDPAEYEQFLRSTFGDEAFDALPDAQKHLPEPGWWEPILRAPRPPDPDERAARRMFDRLGPDPSLRWPDLQHVNGHLLPDFALAREVLALTGRPEEREVIHVERTTDRVLPTTLGFDVGQWAGSPFSIVLDTMLFPQWHPAPDEDVPALLTFSRQLNEHLLFPTAAQAQAFHDWYVAHDWAEIGTFPVIRVDQVSQP